MGFPELPPKKWTGIMAAGTTSLHHEHSASKRWKEITAGLAMRTRQRKLGLTIMTMHGKRIVAVIAVICLLGSAPLGFWAWAQRPGTSSRIPGYAWVGTTDGTTTSCTTRVTAALALHGIPSIYDSMICAC